MLAGLLSDPLGDPMAAEVVSVPTRGIERWLTQQLSAHLGVSDGRKDGVCANIDFPFPGSLVSGALARAMDTEPEADPWFPQRAVWPLIEVVEAHFDEPWLAPLAQHIKNSATVEGSRRFSSIRHMADLFDRYAVHRPDMLQRWAAGSPQLDEATWQVELWRLLRERIGTPSPAERLRDACRRLKAEPELLDLPANLPLRPHQAAGQLPRGAGSGWKGAERSPLPDASVTGVVGPAGAFDRAVVPLGAAERGPDGGSTPKSAVDVVGSRRARDATGPRRRAAR